MEFKLLPQKPPRQMPQRSFCSTPTPLVLTESFDLDQRSLPPKRPAEPSLRRIRLERLAGDPAPILGLKRSESATRSGNSVDTRHLRSSNQRVSLALPIATSIVRSLDRFGEGILHEYHAARNSRSKAVFPAVSNPLGDESTFQSEKGFIPFGTASIGFAQ
jgi:hypothetical protein